MPTVDATRMTRLGRVAKSHRMIRRCGHLAESQAFDIVHHLYLDGAELAWLRAPRQSDRSWVTFASRFTMEFPGEAEVNTTGTGSRHRLAGLAVASAKRRALRKIVASGRLDGIFVHSARARSALRELLGPDTPAGVVTSIPDPAPPLNSVPQSEVGAPTASTRWPDLALLWRSSPRQGSRSVSSCSCSGSRTVDRSRSRTATFGARGGGTSTRCCPP